MLAALKSKVLRSIYDKSIDRRLSEFVAPRYPVLLEYPISPVPRYGYGKPPHEGLRTMLARGDEDYRTTLQSFVAFEPGLASIAEHAVGDLKPYWQSTFFSALDAIALYGFIGTRRPSRIIEVGSGNSTKFARQAITDFDLATKIISIDPMPRAEIDALCDQVIRQPMEAVDPEFFDQLQAGDFLFVDNSHRVFQNSDVTAFFLDVLPRLSHGVVVHVHDIFLPCDYPASWAERHYSEQYLLAAFLLGQAPVRTLLPLAYISDHEQLMSEINTAWSKPQFQRSVERYRKVTGGYAGTSYWLEIAAAVYRRALRLELVWIHLNNLEATKVSTHARM